MLGLERWVGPGSSSRGRMSEDKVRRKDWCWSVRAVYVLVKLPDVSGPGLGEAGRYIALEDLRIKSRFLRSNMSIREVGRSGERKN